MTKILLLDQNCKFLHCLRFKSFAKNSAQKFYIFVANIVKNSDKEKYVYSGYETAFNGKSEWSFDNDYTRNVIIFGVDSSLSSHADNLKNNFLILDEGDTLVHQRKS